jgi:hypothetical protein
MKDYSVLKKSFLSEYINLYSWMIPGRIVSRLTSRWIKSRSNMLGVRKTTSIELFEYDYELLNTIEENMNIRSQSEKIRFAMRLGVLAYHYGWDAQLPFTQEVVEEILDLGDGEFEKEMLEEIEMLTNKND